MRWRICRAGGDDDIVAVGVGLNMPYAQVFCLNHATHHMLFLPKSSTADE